MPTCHEHVANLSVNALNNFLISKSFIIAPFKYVFSFCLQVGFKGFGISEDRLSDQTHFEYEGKTYRMKHGSVVIAAITSCTNTSNPTVMLGAGNIKFLCLKLGA